MGQDVLRLGGRLDMAPRRQQRDQGESVLAAYLRSIDVGLDANVPERIAHFMPTEKSVRLVDALTSEGEDRALIVVAPYGSGKSLAASYALHLVENRKQSRPVLKKLEGRFAEVDAVFATKIAERRSNANSQGLVIPLSGPQEELHRSIRKAVLEAFGRLGDQRKAGILNRTQVKRAEDLYPFLKLLQQKTVEIGLDRVVFVWDEFGKHLEYLVQEGRTSELFHVQKLAEFVARSSVPMTLGLFLHMGFLHYAGTLSQTARTEWRKVEGRFRTIDYIDDSDHLYELIARLIFEKRFARVAPEDAVTHWVGFCRKHHLFKRFSDDRLEALIRSTYPFTPPAVYMLPRLAGRIAQNERTLFHFLENWDGVSEVCPKDLYDYFSPQMRTDISTGGTHRQWLEANSAIQKIAGNPALEAVVKTACLFGLGLYGRNGGASHEFLRRAWSGFERSSEISPCPVRELIDRKLLLYRPYKDEVAVWHGTDLDLRGHLESEKTRRGAGFDLIRFLNHQTPPPAWRPLSYNTEFSIRRYFSSSFHTVSEFESMVSTAAQSGIVEGDGHIAFLLPESPSELNAAMELASRHARNGLVVAYPAEPLPLGNAALEVHCLYQMQDDQDLVASDPLALEEIRQLTGDAEVHLQSLVRRGTIPSIEGPTWSYDGKTVELRSRGELREFLSDICRELYSKTPRLNNELINKKRPSAVVVNSRKKCVLGILERTGSPDLGLLETTPDGSMFRTLLVNTGLYAENGDGSWMFVAPNSRSIGDMALRTIWKSFSDFISRPVGEPKCLEELKSTLLGPPIGMREGVFPIFLAAGIRAFGGMTAIRKDGRLLDDLLPTTLEDMALNPQSYTFDPVSVDQDALKLLRDFVVVFGNNKDAKNSANLLQVAGELLTEWRERLPWCVRTREFGANAIEDFRRAIYSPTDSVAFFTESLPELFAEHKISKNRRRKVMAEWKEELETADQVYYAQIELAIRSALGLDNERQLIVAARERASLFSEDFVVRLSDPKAAHFLRRLRRPYKEDDKLCRSVAQLLTEKRIPDFDDQVMETFRTRLLAITEEIDRAASWVEGTLFGEGLRAWVVGNRHARIKELFTDLQRLEGDARASEYLLGLLKMKENQAT